MAVYFHMKCADDQAEWDQERTPEADTAFGHHYDYLVNPQDQKAVEAVWMRCPTCQKNHGHEITIVEN